MKLILIVVASCYLICCQSQEQNWKLVPQETQVSYLRCWVDNYRSCFWFILYFCSWERIIRCAVDYRTETRNLRTCNDGWTNLPSCLTPICKPQCRTGEICTAPNKCECLTTGGVCTNVPCSESQTCYPGTCNLNKTCLCHQDFYGNDCQKIRRTPTDLKCEVTIQTPTQMNFKATCAPSNSDPEIKWVNSITNILLRLESAYDSSGLNLPDSTVANYVKFPYSLGVSKIGYSMIHTSASGFIKSAYNGTCPGYSADAPNSKATCDIVKTYQDTGMKSLSLNDTLQIYVQSNLGGYVEGSNLNIIRFSTFPKRMFNGDETNSSAKFKIDNEPPVHCLNDPTASCPFFPIYLENDITTERTIYPQFLGWTDSASGINRYHIEVYLLRASVTNALVNTGNPILVKDIKSNENNVAITCSTPGVYSIELTVYDQVNNNASARNIFIYNDKNGIKTNPDKPLQVKEAVKLEENKNEWWITDVSKLNSKSITISWDGYCSSNGKFNSEWTLPVESWNKGIDDRSYNGRRYGHRTIEDYNGLKEGIYSYSISSYVGPKSDMQFTQTADYNSTTKAANINYTSFADGTTIGVQFACADMSGGRITEELFITFDTSSATVANLTLQKNYPDIYTSNVNVWIKEKDSGIKSINYKIFLGSNNNNNPFISQSIAPKIRDAPNTNKGRKRREVLEGPCTVDDKSCYCTPLGHCYNYYQSVGIDHCLIDRVNDNDFYFEITVTNLAGLTSSVQRVKMEDMKDLECRPANRLTSGQIAAIVICVLILVAILAIIMFLLLRIYLFKKPVPRPISNAYVSIMSKITRRNEEPVSTPNELYISDSDYERGSECNKNDFNDYNNEYTKLRLPENSITLKEELNKGKLTMVNKAIFNDNRTKETVAVKYLKNGSSSKSKKMFEEKINFLGDLTTHENIVKFIGICEKPQGPMMVLEYCELPLKTWLSGLGKMTPDILDDMCVISLNVSNGVEHLHERKIIHKRLLAKNVLLTKQYSRYVAKLIGFGPDRYEDNSDAKTSVPIKWLAPETLETIADSHPTYNEKTDAWTYGILLWEIYDKANSQPYPELRSNEAKNAIIKGAKMSRPDGCPPLIFEHVMTKCWSTDPWERPKFSKISSEVEAYRSSCPDSTGYYAPA